MSIESRKNNESNYTKNDHDVRTEMRMKEVKVSEKVQGKHDDDVEKSESKMVFVDNDAWSEIEDAVNAAREHNSLHSLQQMCNFTSELVKIRVELWKPTEMLQLIAQVIIIPVNSSAESILAKRLRQTKQEMQKHLLVRSTPLKFSLNREKRLSSLMDALEKHAQESTKRISTAKDNNTQYDKEENAMVLNLMKINENDTSMLQTNNNSNVEDWTERAIAEMLIHYSQGGEISFMNPADAAFVHDPNELMNMMAGNNNQANVNEEEQEAEMIYGGDSDNDYEDISFDDNDFIEDTSVD